MSADMTWIDIQFLAADMLRFHPVMFILVGTVADVALIIFGRWLVGVCRTPAFVRKRTLFSIRRAGAGR